MGLKVTGISSTANRLENVGVLSNKKALQALRDGAQAIKTLAELWAPRDKGVLEDSFRIEESREGIKNRVVIDVFVDESIKNGKKYVGQYATLVHEGIPDTANYGKNKPGSRTHFLSDAVDRYSPEIGRKISEAINQAIRRS